MKKLTETKKGGQEKGFRSIFPEAHGIGSPMLASPSLGAYWHDMGKKEREMGARHSRLGARRAKRRDGVL